MKSLQILSLLFASFFITSLLHAEMQSNQEKSGIIEAEYQGNHIEFALLKSNYKVSIQGDLATIELEQSFSNPSNVPLNATYLFPLNKDAAVYAMQMKVGDELIEAKINRIEEAKQQFEEAKQQGKAASMLEQHRPNMFTQNLANLMPNLPITITIKYTQAIERKDKQYELVLPLLVGPRFQPGLSIPPAEETANSKNQFNQWELQTLPTTPPTMGIDLPKTLESDRVSISVNINAGMPIHSINSQSHSISHHKVDDNNSHEIITLKSGATIDNRDFVLRYQLSDKNIQAAMLSHSDEKGNYFSLLIEPPAISTRNNTISREMVFVLDTSGSMNGFPLDASKAFMRQALKNLRATDSFRIIDFGDSPREFNQAPLIANEQNLEKGLEHINQLQAYGGTYIVSAIEQALTVAQNKDQLRIVVFLTDGYIGNESEVLNKINDIRGNARIYALGVGSGVNRYLLDEMGNAGKGFARYIDPTNNIEDSAIKFANYLEAPVLSDIKINWGTLKPTQLSPKNLPDLFMGDSLRILGKFSQKGEHNITITGLINGKKAKLPLKITPNGSNKHSKSIPLIWARSQIKDWMREFSLPSHLKTQHDVNNEQIKQNIIKLGLDHSLMTRWTSFIAISNKVLNKTGNAKDSQVPLPMPAGVSKLAYNSNNFAGSSAPEPSIIKGLLLMTLLTGAVLYYRRKRLFVS